VNLQQPLGESFGVEDDPALLHLAGVDLVGRSELGLYDYVAVFSSWAMFGNLRRLR
jgi:hypothetical protein